jgi:hypothetical protein
LEQIAGKEQFLDFELWSLKYKLKGYGSS